MNTTLQEVDQYSELAELDQADMPTGPRSVPFAAVSKVKHIQTDGVYVKTTFVPKDIKFYTKRTPDEHVAILAYGEMLIIESEDKQTRLRAPANYIIPANSRTACYTLSDCVFYCIHATDETNIDVLDRIY